MVKYNLILNLSFISSITRDEYFYNLHDKPGGFTVKCMKGNVLQVVSKLDTYSEAGVEYARESYKKAIKDQNLEEVLRLMEYDNLQGLISCKEKIHRFNGRTRRFTPKRR